MCCAARGPASRRGATPALHGVRRILRPAWRRRARASLSGRRAARRSPFCMRQRPRLVCGPCSPFSCRPRRWAIPRVCLMRAQRHFDPAHLAVFVPPSNLRFPIVADQLARCTPRQPPAPSAHPQAKRGARPRSTHCFPGPRPAAGAAFPRAVRAPQRFYLHGAGPPRACTLLPALSLAQLPRRNPQPRVQFVRYAPTPPAYTLSAPFRPTPPSPRPPRSVANF